MAERPRSTVTFRQCAAMYSSGGKGARGASAPGGTVQGGIWMVENGIMKFCRFWQIGICIADREIQPLMSPNTPRFWA